MKKLNRLFAILIAVLGVSATAKAYTTADLTAAGWSKVESITDVANYYYVFVDARTSAYMIADDHNRNRAYYLDLTNPITYANSTWLLEANNDSYALKNAATARYYNSGNWGWDPFLSANNDNANYKLTLTDGKYSIQSVKTSSYLGPWNNDGAVVGNGENIAANKGNNQAPGFLIYSMERSQYESKSALAFDQATSTNPINLTSKIDNPDADWKDYGMSGWTTVNTIGWKDLKGYDDKVGFFEFCNWGSSWNGSMSQTITSLPNGKYIVKVAAQAAATDVVVTLTANGMSTDLNCIGDNGGSISADGTEVALGSGVAGWQYMEVECVVVNGELSITVYSAATTNSRWANVDNFTIIYCGKDLTTYEDALSSTITTAQSIDRTKLTSEVTGILNNAINEAQIALSDGNRTVESLEEQTELLQAAIALANDIVAPYASLNTLVELCTTYAAESHSNVATNDVRTTFTTAINTATNNGDAAATVAALNEVYSTLEAARQAYVKAAIPTTGNSFDMTFLMTNPQVTSADGWTNGGTATGQQYTGAPDNTYLDFYQVTRDMYQTLSGLPSGSYFVKAATRGHADVSVGYIYVQNGENKITTDIHKVGNEGNTLGGGWDWTTTNDIAVTDGQLTIGFYAECGSEQWVGADVFSLYRAYDESLAAPMQASVTSLKSEAEALVDEIMSSKTKEALTTAINGADASSTNPFALNTMIVDLSSAIAEAQASIADYEKLKRYIAMTKVFTDVTAYEAQYNNGAYTSDDVDPARKELNIARYNAASAVFTNKVEVKGWTGDLANGIRSDQHWSGVTRDYFDANSWTPNYVDLKHTLSTTITLPEGTYVLKAAGRSDSDVTLTLNIKDGDNVLESVEYTGKGDTGYGIDTKGDANFSAEGTYANNNAGRGWEWEFAKFELDAETTVTLHVEVDYNSIQNRFGSFSDITLWMDDKTYVTVNGHAIDEPLTSAKTMVDSKPMGANENNELKAAIERAEGKISTPEELDGAVNALNTAIDNANAWIAAYNEKKAPLVAALERFEADYNDAQNGALDYMNKNRWAESISMAQEAAVAKDVTDSYEGFEMAAKNLNDALDAATTSIGEYNNLKTAIENAEEPSGDDWGSEPFQKPISVKEDINNTKAQAQAAYNAAEVDGKEVAAVIESLNTAIDEVVLNAPAEGQRFYIKVATEGHGKYGNAVLSTLGATGDNNPTGYGLNANNEVKPYLNQAFIFTQVEGNLYNISIERTEGTVYLTYGELNGSAAGWNKQQIQATTDAEKKGEFKIVPTGKNGVLKILNTIDNNYIDCQDGGSIYTDAKLSAEEFAFELVAEANITLTIPEEGWTTWILPFNAELPEDVKAYSCCEINGDKLTLVEAESLKANTPYLVNYSYESDYGFTGYGLADKDSYTDGLFTGTYVEYQTTANSNAYVLQNINSEVAFYLVGEDEQPTVDAYSCYITYEAQEGEEQAAMFLLSGGQEDDPTAVEGAERKAQNAVVVYDLMGRKVSSMKKGNMYIVNGVKVIIK